MDRLMADWSQKPADIDKGVLGRVPLNPVFISLWFCMNAHLSIFFVQPLGSDYSGDWCEARCKSQACEIPQSSFIYFRQVHLISFFKLCFPKNLSSWAVTMFWSDSQCFPKSDLNCFWHICWCDFAREQATTEYLTTIAGSVLIPAASLNVSNA